MKVSNARCRDSRKLKIIKIFVEVLRGFGIDGLQELLCLFMALSVLIEHVHYGEHQSTLRLLLLGVHEVSTAAVMASRR